MSADNTYVSKTLNGVHAGRVGYSCKQCHRASVQRMRARQAWQRHTWVGALVVPLTPAVAQSWARRVDSERQHVKVRRNAVEVVGVHCARCGTQFRENPPPCEPYGRWQK